MLVHFSQRWGEGPKQQPENSQDLLWHSHAQADNSDCPWAEAHGLLQSTHDYLIKQRSHLCQSGGGTSLQAQWALQGTAGGQRCKEKSNSNIIVRAEWYHLKKLFYSGYITHISILDHLLWHKVKNKFCYLFNLYHLNWIKGLFLSKDSEKIITLSSRHK